MKLLQIAICNILISLTACAHVMTKDETCESFCQERGMACEDARIGGPTWNSCRGDYDSGPEYLYCKKIIMFEVKQADLEK